MGVLTSTSAPPLEDTALFLACVARTIGGNALGACHLLVAAVGCVLDEGRRQSELRSAVLLLRGAELCTESRGDTALALADALRLLLPGATREPQVPAKT